MVVSIRRVITTERSEWVHCHGYHIGQSVDDPSQVSIVAVSVSKGIDEHTYNK